jgi:hypothetical protein
MTENGSEAGTPRSRARSRSKRRQRARVVAGIVAVVLVGGLAFFLLRPPASTPVAATPTPSATTPAPSPTPTPKPSPCETQTSEEFTPTRVTVPGVVRNASVLALPRDGRNVPSVPPVSETGKQQVAWDRPPGIKPGAPKGNVLLNAHTWPDGSALGNKLLADLDKGGRIIVRGDGATLCYEVSKRVEVPGTSNYPPYFDREGPPQLAIIVCSGKRLGPGNWTHRTIWFASPA